MKTISLTLAALMLTGTAAMAQYYTPIPPPQVPQNLFQNIVPPTTTMTTYGNQTYIRTPGERTQVCSTYGNQTTCR